MGDEDEGGGLGFFPRIVKRVFDLGAKCKWDEISVQ